MPIKKELLAILTFLFIVFACKEKTPDDMPQMPTSNTQLTADNLVGTWELDQFFLCSFQDLGPVLKVQNIFVEIEFNADGSYRITTKTTAIQPDSTTQPPTPSDTSIVTNYNQGCSEARFSINDDDSLSFDGNACVQDEPGDLEFEASPENPKEKIINYNHKTSLSAHASFTDTGHLKLTAEHIYLIFPKPLSDNSSLSEGFSSFDELVASNCNGLSSSHEYLFKKK